MKITQQWITRSVIQYISVHLFLTIASLPLLVAWGLPLSRLSIVGNFLFSPVLFLFLLFSSALFFCEILLIPHGSIGWLLDKVTLIWNTLLPLHSNDTLYGFGKPYALFLIICAIAPFILIAHPAMRSSHKRIVGLSLLYLLTMAAIPYASPTHKAQTEIPCHGKTVTLLCKEKTICLIDPGAIGRRISAPSWVSYTLTPELIAKTGALSIDHLILLKPSIMTFEGIRTLGETITVRNLYLPYMYGELTGPLRVAWAKLYHTLIAQRTVLHRIYEDKPLEITEQDITLTLQPGTRKTYRDISYPETHIAGSIQDIPVNL